MSAVKFNVLSEFYRVIGLSKLCVSVLAFLGFIILGGCGSFKVVEIKKGAKIEGKEKAVSSRVHNVDRKNIKSSKAARKPVNSIESSVLIVNSNHITADEIIYRIMPDLVLAGQKYSERMYYAKARELAMQAIYDMIYETLLYEDVSGRISEEQNPAIEKAIDVAIGNMIERDAGGSRIRFEKQLAERGMDIPALRKQLRKQILTQQYLREKFRSKVIVTRDDLWEYYRTHRKEFYTPARAHVLMIELKVDNYLPKNVRWSMASKEQRQIAEVLAERRAEMILKQLNSGKRFSDLAREYSDSPSGKLGGDVGWITRGSYRHKKIENCVFRLKPGQVSKPIRVGRKIYIIKLAELVRSKTVPFVDAQRRIKKKLEQKIYANLVNEHVQKLWKKSQISPIQPFLETVMKRIPNYYEMKSKRSSLLP